MLGVKQLYQLLLNSALTYEFGPLVLKSLP